MEQVAQARNLRHKPLVEAILEVKWALQPIPDLMAGVPGVGVDPHYRLLLARFYDRVQHRYPSPEELPAASLPEQITGQTVQHRFRHAIGEWPLLQLGPGILTLNDTQGYTWGDFQQRAVDAVGVLFDAHPRPKELHINSLSLRYINAVEFDYETRDAFAFLGEHLHVTVALPDELFEAPRIGRRPRHVTWQSSFGCDDPAGLVTVGFATGRKDGRPSVLWETLVHSETPTVPTLPDGFRAWIRAAHDVSEDWFFKLIEGDLERRFRGEQ